MSNGASVPARKAESSLAPPVDEEIGFQVIERLAVGRSLEEIGAIPGMPNKETFLVWVSQSPALAQAFTIAREVSAYALEEETLTMLRRLREETPSQARLRSTQMLAEHIRWAAEKRNPKVYAKQAAVNMTVTVQINTTLDMGGQTSTNTKEFPNIYELKAVHVNVEELSPVEEGERERVTRRERVERKDTIEKQAESRKRRRAAEKAYRNRKKVLTPKGQDGSNPQDGLRAEPSPAELHREQGEGGPVLEPDGGR